MFRIRSATLGVALLTGVLLAMPASAQRRNPRGARAQMDGAEGKRVVAALFEGIHLSGAQKDSVKAISERYRPQYEALRDSVRPDAERAAEARRRGDTVATRQAKRDARDERLETARLLARETDELRALLTPEQQKTFDANRARVRERAKDRLRDGPRRRRPRAS
jgi:Spy/CpxP family protein refolding chaperone